MPPIGIEQGSAPVPCVPRGSAEFAKSRLCRQSLNEFLPRGCGHLAEIAEPLRPYQVNHIYAFMVRTCFS